MITVEPYQHIGACSRCNVLPAPAIDNERTPASQSKEHGFAIGGARSADRANTRGDPAMSTAITIDLQSEPDDDEQEAWLASIVE